jgi:acetylornithine aminotransferase
MFAHQHSAIVPDVMTLAKALGNGVPIGACLARGRAAELFGPGSHGSTFGGNPLVCRAANTTLEIIERDNLTAHAAAMGQHLSDGFRTRLGDHEQVVEIRNKGLMIGIELARPCSELVKRALDSGLLINVTADRVVRLLPPLIITQAEADPLVASLSDLIEAFLATA